MSRLLEKYAVQYRLGTGALLGAHRDGDFIPWDWDVGVDVDASSMKSNLTYLVANLEAIGFHGIKVKRTALNIKVLGWWKDAEFELMGWRQDREGNRRRKFLFLPKHIWEGSSQITIRGVKVATYRDVEEYLTHFYGRWRRPIKSTVNEDYCTSNVLRRDWLDIALSLPIGRVRN